MGKVENAILEQDPDAFVASDRLKAKELYQARSKYKEQLATEASNGTKMPYIDMWYDKTLYGRIDSRFTPVYPSETNLVMLSDECTTLDFVADAFSDFRRRWEELSAQGIVEPVGLLQKLSPEAGWVSLHENYHMYIEELFIEVQEWLKTVKNKHLVDFYDFFDLFVEYVDNNSPQKVFTRSSYITSANCDPRISGLIIELKRPAVTHDNDYGKYRGFITDPNFELFALTAAQYGFYIDKNAPFRLVANINSDAMRDYMQKYGINSLHMLFNKYYYAARKKDQDSLVPYVQAMWNSYASSFPYQTVSHQRQVSSGQYITRNKMYQRVLLSETDKPFSDLEAVIVMFYIRCKEASLLASQQDFDKHVLNIKRLWATNRRATIDYMDEVLEGYPVPSPGGNPQHRIHLDNVGESRYNIRGSTNNVGNFVYKVNRRNSAVSDS